MVRILNKTDSSRTTSHQRVSGGTVCGKPAHLLVLSGIVASLFCFAAQGQVLGPSPYLQASDSPFANQSFNWFYLETFEDSLLNTPGVTASRGNTINRFVNRPQDDVDSVDGDDGLVDGSGRNGWSWFAFNQSGSAVVSFSFDATALAGLPTHAGIVWTDGYELCTFEAFGEFGQSLGTVSANTSDGNFLSGTAEDRFYGIIHYGGISSIRIDPQGPGLELDHLQYGRQCLTIASHPASTLCCRNGAKSLATTAYGIGSLTYQWRQGGNPIDPIANPSAATATLTLTNVQPADAGSYDCIVTNVCGTVTSNAADLNVDCNCQTNVTSTVTAGVPDAFSTDNGLEMGTPRPDFAAHLAQRLPGRDLLQFDSDSRNAVEYNRFVAHSFTGLPADITAATITTRVRAGGTNDAANEGTDSVSIGHSFSATDFQGYKRFFGNENLPFLFNFPWRRYTASPQSNQTFTTPPLGAAIITRMNTLGYLDFLVEDDTAVDYVALQYTRAGPVPSGVNVAWIRSQPVNVGPVCAGTPASFAVTAAVTGPFTYQWQKNSIAIDTIANPSAATATLALNSVTAADAAAYDCVVTGACSSVTSTAATLTIGGPTCCPADINADGELNPDDLADYIGAFFAVPAGTGSDFNGDGTTDPDDLADYIGAFFNGCG